MKNQQNDHKKIMELEKANKLMELRVAKLEDNGFTMQERLTKELAKLHDDDVKIHTEMCNETKAIKGQIESPQLADRITQALDEALKAKCDAKLKDLEDAVKLHGEQLKRMEEYLGDLEASRPREGRTVVEAFVYMQGQVTKVQEEVSKLQAAPAAPTAAAAGSASASSSAGASLGLSEGGAYMVTYMTHETALNKLRKELEDTKRELDVLTVKVCSKCHCAHVDAHSDHLGAVQLQLDSLAESVKPVMEVARLGVLGFGLGLAGAANQAAGAAPGHPGAPARAGGGAAAGAPGGAPLCGGCGAPHGAPGAAGHGAPGGSGPPGGGSPWFVGAQVGGNNICHCRHVVDLQTQMVDVAQRLAALERGGGGRQPLIPPPGVPFGAMPGAAPGAVPQYSIHTPAQSATTLPLRLGPLGGLATGRLFDDKMTSQEGYRFDGTKGGDRWKGKLERYFMSKCPALRAILEWAERTDTEVVTEEMLEEAVGAAMDAEQRETLNSALWGFISNCVSGEAETMFKRARPLNGVDAWRRLVRYIDHGRTIRCETLRSELRTIHLRPIKNLESLAVGIAEFENKHAEYFEAGGPEAQPDEKKADLLAILPEQLRENLLWRATDPGPYEAFRDMVQAQAAKVLLNRRRLPVHAVVEETREEEPVQGAMGFDDVEDLIAAIRSGKFQPRARDGAKTRRPDAPKQFTRPIRCPNCGGEHSKDACTKTKVALGDRTCWECGEKGHTASRCTKRKPRGAIKAVDDAMPVFGMLACIDNEGFQKARGTVKPRPHIAMLGGFMDKNTFGALQLNNLDETEEDVQQSGGLRAQGTASLGSVSVGRATEQRSGTRGPAPLIRSTKKKAQTGGKQPATAGRFDAVDMHSLEDVLGSQEFSKLFPELGLPPAAEPDMKAAARLVEADWGEIDEVEVEKLRAQAEWRKKQARASRQQKTLLCGTDAPCQASCCTSDGQIATLNYEDAEDDLIGNTDEVVEVDVAMDSGAVDNVIHAAGLPTSVSIEPNTSGRHFQGPGGERIKNHGTCVTTLTDEQGRQVGCQWRHADVTRALNSVSRVAGPEDGPGEHDVLFNNKRCVVVPPGVVEKILSMLNITPITEYRRSGGLYTAKMKVSGFARQGRKQ